MEASSRYELVSVSTREFWRQNLIFDSSNWTIDIKTTQMCPMYSNWLAIGSRGWGLTGEVDHWGGYSWVFFLVSIFNMTTF